MRGAKLSAYETGLRPRPWGEALLKTVEPRHPITEGINATGPSRATTSSPACEMYEGAQVLLTTFDDLEAYETRRSGRCRTIRS